MIAPRLPALLLLLLSVAGTAQASCNEQILAATCADSPASGSCAICVGHHQRELRLAGCSAADVQRYCSEGVAVWVSSTSGSDTAGDGRSPTTALRTLAAALPAVAVLGARLLHHAAGSGGEEAEAARVQGRRQVCRT